MTVPKLLLLSNCAPGRWNVGRLFLGELCRGYPQGRIACYHLDHLPADESDPELQWLPRCEARPPSEHGFARLGRRLRRLTRVPYERYVELAKIPPLVAEAVRFGRQHEVDLVWSPLRTPTVIRMAWQVARELGVPLVTMVWDPLDYTLRDYALPAGTLRRLLGTAEATIRASRSCGVASEGMRERFESRYGVRTVVMVMGVERVPVADPGGPLVDGPFVVGYAGSVYAHDAWDSLIGALSSAGWSLHGRDVVLRMMGTHLAARATAPMRIEYLGWRGPEETARLLARCHVGYLPYWFGSEYADVIRQTFPNKLAAYAAARLPVLYHGPEDATPTRFLERYPMGVSCHSMGPDHVLAALGELSPDGDRRPAARHACDEAYAGELSPTVFRSRFAELLGIESRWLRT